ncbi:glutamate/gamma-aminobutyrate family transporter YjeM [Aeromonas schubertii]|uniref:glutamate/gamma-aminobutyrate family transporter YjeM n=1 Tax=Aeromonas schubertii TaxID=652 RepID=UPI0010A892F6|nr:glutamate/gamma-aminobutyrate family transporter YjeM [Aeromonas schubertii]QCG46796.1 glutamate/gamma-aminobutyrate family transporter YjeM [Aeromonas schubertii]
MASKKLKLGAFILMILTSVFGVTNIGIGFYRMGYAAIPMFVIGGLFFFIPFILMMIEFGTGFRREQGGIFTWMRHSVSTRFAFIGLTMWFASYIIWMFGKALSMWVPLSFMLFGRDVTVIPLTLGTLDVGPFLLGVVAIALVLIVSRLITLGSARFAKVAAIGGLSVVALNILLLVGGVLVFALSGMTLQEPLQQTALTTSPNAAFNDLIPFLGFMVFAIFAYGGVEAMAGVADELEDPERDLKRGIFLSGAFIVLCYVIGFLAVGAIMRWSDFPSEGITSLSALFIIMLELGRHLGGEWLGQVLMRFAGLGMFLSYLGAFIALSYAPLRQFITGTPSYFWPERFQRENENGVRTEALKVQALVVCAFIAVKSIFTLINPEGAAALYELIITMTNVGMTIPYMFLIYAWYRYRQNPALEKDLIFFRSPASVLGATLVSLLLVAFGNLFTLVSPFLAGDISTGVWTMVGPLLFALIAMRFKIHRGDEH